MTTFADATGSNTATLSKPSWAALETVELNRPGIVSSAGDHAVEVSNHSIDIPMIAGYQQSAMSLVFYVEPRGELRGTQYWNQSEEKFGREFLAHADDGSTPGSFAVYRRRVEYGNDDVNGQWRLGGYVRDSGGTKQYFGGGLAGIATALLPIDTAKRVVLTQGPAGAELWLDGTKVATVSTTEGWSSLSGSIRFGAGDEQDKIYDRSPFWGRFDEIRIYSGQMGQSDVDALPVAQDALIYRIPTTGTLINIAAHAGAGNPLQSAMDAAHNAPNGWVFQDESDLNWYGVPINTAIGHRANCRGMVGVRLRKASGESARFQRMFVAANTGAGGFGQLGNHGDPYAANGGYQYIGCKFDGNARNQDWSATGATTTSRGFDLEFAHCFQSESDQILTATFDSCEFFDSTGDGISASGHSKVTAKGNRFFGVFRGSYVVNDLVDIDFTILRSEAFLSAERIGGRRDNGGGLCDVEPFQPAGSDRVLFHVHDTWAEGDWDDRNYELTGQNSQSHYFNVHTTRAALALQPHRGGAVERDPTSSIRVSHCTVSFYRQGISSSPSGGGTWPLETFRGFSSGVAGEGALFEHTVLLANGRPLAFHEFGYIDPKTGDGAPKAGINYGGSSSGRLITMRDCEFRVADLPSGITTANTRCVDFPTLSTAEEIELDRVDIDGAFANLPFNMGGITVFHRDVLHERTSSATPWSNAGNVVAL